MNPPPEERKYTYYLFLENNHDKHAIRTINFLMKLVIFFNELAFFIKCIYIEVWNTHTQDIF